MTIDLKKMTIAKARKALDIGEYSAVDLTNAYLIEIEKSDAHIHAYLEVWMSAALAEASAADTLIKEGKQLPLTGIPIAIKDNILIEGRTASAASKMLEHYTASYDATVIKKLKAQGAIFLGRTNMDEFAMGGSTENSAFGITRNPIDPSRVPGGSSGGSAAAVSGNMAVVSLGSDTGGSIRQPAALTGIVGFKPTYGAISRLGLMAMGSSLDQIGTLSQSVSDAKTVFEIIKGHDPLDSTSIPNYALGESSNKKMTIGVPRHFMESGVDLDVLVQFEDTITRLKEKGHTIINIKLPSIAYALAMYYILMPAEASTNLDRFDGIRYGLTSPSPDIRHVYDHTRRDGFGPEVRRRILLGTFVLSSGYVDAYYRKARDVRELLRQDFERVFKDCDAIITPTSPIPAFTIGSKSDPVTMYAADVFTVPVNLAGLPGISVPSGSVVRDGMTLPVGFQIIAPWKKEQTLFDIGFDVEEA